MMIRLRMSAGAAVVTRLQPLVVEKAVHRYMRCWSLQPIVGPRCSPRRAEWPDARVVGETGSGHGERPGEHLRVLGVTVGGDGIHGLGGAAVDQRDDGR